jgi:hypothetical protein
MTYQQEYKRLRTKGFAVVEAKRTARINVAFSRAEQDGIVRFKVVPDNIEPYDDSYIDTWDCPDEEKLQLKRDLWEKIEREGVWGIVVEKHVKCEHCKSNRWDQVESCWGFVGEDWKDSGYDLDFKMAALQAVGICMDSKKKRDKK